MSKSFKLVVSPRVEFDVKFTLNDGGKDKRFGMRMAGQRQPLSEQVSEFSDQIKIKDFLEARGIVMTGWLGAPALVGENDEPVPVGAEALSALYELVVGMTELVFAEYQKANRAQGRSGN